MNRHAEEPEPDDKDWTWVLTRPCPECGFDAGAVDGAGVPPRLLEAVATLRRRLDDPDATERPAPGVWSPVEYACHVRDVCRVIGVRMAMMLGTSDPVFANWNQDETAVAEDYRHQAPAVVSGELAEESMRFAGQLEGVRDQQWQRPGRRSDGAVFTVDSLARYCLHDVLHHAWDVTASG